MLSSQNNQALSQYQNVITAPSANRSYLTCSFTIKLKTPWQTKKSNNVRILQSTQKNNLPPLAHAAIGFLVGAAVIIVAGLGYFYLSSDDQPANTEMTTSAPTEDKAETEATTAPRQSENEQSSAEKALQSVHAMDKRIRIMVYIRMI